MLETNIEADAIIVCSLTNKILVNIFGEGTDNAHFLSQNDSANINALAWDSDTGTIFWADSYHQSIFSSGLPVCDTESGHIRLSGCVRI